MPHTYADLLELLENATIITADSDTNWAATSSLATGNPSSAGVLPTVDISELGDLIEADDDPHRLARVNLERYATRLGADGQPAGRTLRYWRDEWWSLKNLRYRKLTEREFKAKVTGAIRLEFERLSLVETQMMKNENSDGELPAVKKVTTALTNNVLQATAGMVCLSSEIEPGTWLPDRQRKNWISMQNGILDVDAVLAGGEMADCMRPNSPDWFSFVNLPYAFDPLARCPVFDAFLEHNLEMDPERIKLLQEWAGYLLLPNTDEQKFMILVGEGRNGKSVFIAALTAMLGRENVSNVPLENFGQRFALTGTLGKLLNACTDCSEIEKAAEGVFKSFASGDRMFFDRKGISGLTCEPTARVMLATNELPRIADRSQGIWRRMLVVPWKVEIEKEKRVRGMDKISFWIESGELPGVLNWAIEGLARLRMQRGFTESEEMDRVKNEHMENSNPARKFLKEHCEEHSGSAIRSAALYELYNKWAVKNGYYPLSSHVFGREIPRVFRHSKKKQKSDGGQKIWVNDGIKFSVDEICGQQVDEYKLF